MGRVLDLHRQLAAYADIEVVGVRTWSEACSAGVGAILWIRCGNVDVLIDHRSGLDFTMAWAIDGLPRARRDGAALAEHIVDVAVRQARAPGSPIPHRRYRAIARYLHDWHEGDHLPIVDGIHLFMLLKRAFGGGWPTAERMAELIDRALERDQPLDRAARACDRQGMSSINLLGRSRRRRARKGATGCIKANGRLKKGCRWAKGRKGVAIRVRRR